MLYYTIKPPLHYIIHIKFMLKCVPKLTNNSEEAIWHDIKWNEQKVEW